MGDTLAEVFGGMVMGFIIGVLVGIGLDTTVSSKDAIAHHAAHYDGQTGKFTWNEEDPGGK